MSLAQTIASIASEHADTLAVDPASITAERGSQLVSRGNVQTTTEALLLLAAFHLDVDDTVGAALLAEFAAKFAAVESNVV